MSLNIEPTRNLLINVYVFLIVVFVVVIESTKIIEHLAIQHGVVY